MPTDGKIFGFSNRWYSAALREAAETLINDLRLRVVTAPYFIGTKLEAFHGRGAGDYHASRDLEDLISVVNGRPSLLKEVKAAPPDLRGYIADEIGALLDNREFIEALPGHVPGDDASQARIPTLLRTLGEFRSMKESEIDSTRRRRSRVSTRNVEAESMAAFTFEQLYEATAKGSLGTQDKERLRVQITLVEHLVEALRGLEEAVILSGMANAGIAGYAGSPNGQKFASHLDPDKSANRLAKLAKELGLL